MQNDDATDRPQSSAQPWRTLLLLALVLGGCMWAERPDGRLHIWFLDTSGDAALIQTPDGQFALIDGGSDPAQLALLLGRYMPAYQRRLALVVLTSGDAKRLPGQVAALGRYHAKRALAPETPGTAIADEWQRLLVEQGSVVRIAEAGDSVTLGGVRFLVPAVTGGKKAQLALQLDYGHTHVLWHTSGAKLDPDLLASASPLSVLVYPWQRELETELLARWQPQHLVFSSAYSADEPALLSYAQRRQFARRSTTTRTTARSSLSAMGQP
ncbi:hypothetical protein HC891_01995 [Candidatus Gracilibacteria bacterium]|nr:hypothetical protein [Candidatus Gracilibacteria bacterium]